MATIEDRLSSLEQAMDDVRRQLATKHPSRAWLDEIAGSMEPWPELDEVLKLGREFRKSVVDPSGVGSEAN